MFKMTQWIRNLVTHKRKTQARREQEWRVSTNGGIWLHIPTPLTHPERWEIWGEIQAGILRRFQQCWQDTHIYIRFHTYLPEHFGDILRPGQFESVGTANKEDYIFLFPDCQDEYVWTTILGSAGLVPFARTIFVLDNNPSNWQEVIASLFGIAQKLSAGHPLDKFQSELSICRCLCYSMDEDLVIAKVDLPESTAISILKDTAREKNLELVLDNRVQGFSD
jgi:hypothetical protein